MFIGTNGIVVDSGGHALLILRDDTRTWAIPGGALEAGELPTDGVAREVEEETGIRVTPARLVGLYHWYDRAEDFLALVFRCLIKGGSITRSDESPRVVFTQTDIVPRPILSLHKERLARGLVHTSEAPYWGEQRLTRAMILWRRVLGPILYRSKDIRRKLRGEPAYQPPLPWNVGAFVVIRNEIGDVLWIKRTDYDVWNLPGGGSMTGEAPWTTAIRETREESGLDVYLTGCSGIYVKPARNLMIFTFTAQITGGELTTGDEAAAFEYFSPGNEPDNTLPKHIDRATDAVSMPGDTQFKIQDEPSFTEILGINPSKG